MPPAVFVLSTSISAADWRMNKGCVRVVTCGAVLSSWDLAGIQQVGKAWCGWLVNLTLGLYRGSSIPAGLTPKNGSFLGCLNVLAQQIRAIEAT